MAQEMGVAIPRDVSLVGYDDLPFTRTHPASLTTVHQPIYEMGQESMRRIMCRIRGEKGKSREIVLKSYLVERSSVLPLGKPSKKSKEHHAKRRRSYENRMLKRRLEAEARL